MHEMFTSRQRWRPRTITATDSSLGQNGNTRMVHFAKFQLYFVDLYFSTSYHVVSGSVQPWQTVLASDLMTYTWRTTRVPQGRSKGSVLSQLYMRSSQVISCILPNMVMFCLQYMNMNSRLVRATICVYTTIEPWFMYGPSRNVIGTSTTVISYQ